MDMQVDAQLIRNERLKRAWSQEQLAQVSGLGLRTVQRIENGGNASLETIKALGAVFELPVESLLGESMQPATPPPSSRFHLFRPWRTFAAGCFTSAITLGGFVVMQGAVAEQVDMDFTVRLDNEEVTLSRLVGETGTAVVVDVSERMKISITPTIMEDGTIFLDAEVFGFEDGEYKLLAAPKLLTVNGRKALFRVGSQRLPEESGGVEFKGIEFEIIPMIE
jgi:transcriptional regulator with XRE-family HTH domain